MRKAVPTWPEEILAAILFVLLLILLFAIPSHAKGGHGGHGISHSNPGKGTKSPGRVSHYRYNYNWFSHKGRPHTPKPPKRHPYPTYQK